MLKSPKTKTLADGLIERTSSMLDKIESKIRGKRSKTLSEVQPVENIIKNLQSFLYVPCKRKSFFHMNYAYEYVYA